MTNDKDLKRRVRARMAKTGESYAAARAQLVAKREPHPSEYAELAGMSDEAVAQKTDKTWAQWVEALDAIDAQEMSHRDIAKAVRERWPAIGGWWAQMVTVSYERIRGLRAKGQQRDTKLFDANKSRTYPVPVSELYAAWGARKRGRWLGDVDVTIRTSKKDRSMRITWPDGTDVHAFFESKGPTKSTVSVQHRKLTSAKAVAKAKEEWHERLDRLRTLLTGK